jgi:hypothetical protein
MMCSKNPDDDQMQPNLRSKKMISTQESSLYGELTVEQARVMRADQARSAALYADRVEQAQADAECGAMAHWIREYRRSTLSCRLLGERIRMQSRYSRAETAKRDPTVVRLAPRPVAGVPATGEAA